MQKNLFESPPQPGNIPLAEKARPSCLEDIAGQNKLLQPGAVLRSMIEQDEYSSFILWGPPGCGKTTIARFIEQQTKHHFASFSAVLSKIGDVKELMQEAEVKLRNNGCRTIVFVDEIHRFNKSQQDAFLPYVESGAIILFGATTENPSFEVISALLSRCHVFILEPLVESTLITILQRASTFLPHSERISAEVFPILAAQAGGDARRALNTLEMICRKTPMHLPVSEKSAMDAMSSRSLFYDKKGEEHYNLISALQKSVRSSDPQAALYWTVRMLESGEDPLYVIRRLVRMASEDIGLADPNALVQALAAKDAVQFLGMPEASTAITQLVIYLATAPKSNRCETAYLAAKEDACKTGYLKVPLHICNAPTSLMKDLGYNKGYRYAHAYENSYSYQKCFPDEMQEKEYYTPSPYGFEKEIKKRLDWWQGLKKNQLAREKTQRQEEEKNEK